MNKKNIITTLLVLFLVGDLVFSFLQYYQSPLQGDITNGVLPGNDVQQVLDDPFGFNALISGEKHVNPNRFFSHFLLMSYFQNVPHLLQYLANPISSVYLSCAIAKILVQISFIYCLAVLISGHYNPLNKKFLLVAVIVTPLFQAYGYWSRMGINDKSISYTFFYGIPLVATMLFLLPLIKSIKTGTNLKPISYVILFPFVIILPLSGPLIPAILILTTALFFIHFWIASDSTFMLRTNSVWRNIPIHIYILLFPAALCSLYALFLGKYDSNYLSSSIPILERYAKLPYGLFDQVFHSLGFLLMLLVIGFNIYLIKKKTKRDEGDKLISIIKWIGYFSALYIFLLPLGGYRPYREYIIRYDTIMPVTTVLIYFFGASTFFLINHLHGKNKIQYLIVISTCLLIFTIADIKGLHRNKCERQAFEKMATYKGTVVPIPKDCFVMDWKNTFDYKKSERNAEMIYFWKITPEKKLFYNEK